MITECLKLRPVYFQRTKFRLVLAVEMYYFLLLAYVINYKYSASDNQRDSSIMFSPVLSLLTLLTRQVLIKSL